MSAVFIMAHHMADMLWEKGQGLKTVSKQELMGAVGQRYQSGPFKKIWQAFSAK